MTEIFRFKPEVVTKEDWGYIQIKMGGQDVTYFRNVPTMVRSWSSADPFGDSSCVINFPQIGPHDSFGSGDLAWFTDFMNIDLWHVQGGTKKKLWEGLVVSQGIEQTANGYSVTATAVGSLFQIDFYIDAPNFFTEQQPAVDMLRRVFTPTSRAALRTTELVNPYPEIEGKFNTYESGAWDRPLTGYAQQILSTMIRGDGKQYSITNVPDRTPKLFVRGEYTDDQIHTVTLGQPGVNINVNRDLMQRVNVIYGEGNDPGGVVWRNSRIQGDGKATHYDPVAFDPLVHGDERIPEEIRLEQKMNFGQMSLAEAKIAGKKIVQREREPGWVGTITLNSDPEERSRWQIRAGDCIHLLWFRNNPCTVFHIAEAEHDYANGSVTLKVDSRARDLLTVEQVQQHHRDHRTPAKLLLINRESQFFKDQVAPWDTQAGSGFVPFHSKDYGPAQNGDRSVGGLYSFPYEKLTSQVVVDDQGKDTRPYSPGENPQAFIPIYPAADPSVSPNDGGLSRWAFVHVMAGEKGTIRLSEFAVYDLNGNVVPCDMHVSLYQAVPVHLEDVILEEDTFWQNGTPSVPSYDDMPRVDANTPPDPFIAGAFRSTLNNTDEDDNALEQPIQYLIAGWGDGDQKAGYWPGLESDGDPKTGCLRDEGTIQYQLGRYNRIITVAIYVANASTDPQYVYGEQGALYVMGRLYNGIEQ